MATVTVPSGIGEVSSEVANAQNAAGNPDARLANTIRTLASQARTDILALEAAGGAGGGNASVRVDNFGALPAAGNNALKTSFASSTSVQTITWADLNGAAVGGGALDHPRTVRLTQSATSGAFVAGNATITGTCRGVAQTATLAMTLNGGATLETVKCFDINEDIVASIPACANGTGTLTLGIGNNVGFGAAPMADADGHPLILEAWVNGDKYIPNGYNLGFNAIGPASVPYGSVTISDPVPNGGILYVVAYLVDA